MDLQYFSFMSSDMVPVCANVWVSAVATRLYSQLIFEANENLSNQKKKREKNVRQMWKRQQQQQFRPNTRI